MGNITNVAGNSCGLSGPGSGRGFSNPGSRDCFDEAWTVKIKRACWPKTGFWLRFGVTWIAQLVCVMIWGNGWKSLRTTALDAFKTCLPRSNWLWGSVCQRVWCCSLRSGLLMLRGLPQNYLNSRARRHNWRKHLKLKCLQTRDIEL